jgi:hypothetical protein
MVHKYLSVLLLLCSVPLIGMERESIIEAIHNDLRNFVKDVDESIAQIEEIEKRTGQDLSSKRSILEEEAGILRERYYRRTGDFIAPREEAPYKKEQYKSALEKAKEEQPAPSQVSPYLDAIEHCSRQSDNHIRECLRKYVGLFRGNL